MRSSYESLAEGTTAIQRHFQRCNFPDHLIGAKQEKMVDLALRQCGHYGGNQIKPLRCRHEAEPERVDSCHLTWEIKSREGLPVLVPDSQFLNGLTSTRHCSISLSSLVAQPILLRLVLVSLLLSQRCRSVPLDRQCGGGNADYPSSQAGKPISCVLARRCWCEKTHVCAADDNPAQQADQTSNKSVLMMPVHVHRSLPRRQDCIPPNTKRAWRIFQGEAASVSLLSEESGRRCTDCDVDMRRENPRRASADLGHAD